MASKRKYRKKWLKWHSQYEKYAYNQITELFKKWIEDINVKTATPENFKERVASVISREDTEETYYNIYAKIGRLHGKRIGDGINIDLKEFIYPDYLSIFIDNIMGIVRGGAHGRIVTVEESFFETIVNIMANRYENNETVRDAAIQIERAINRNDFYRWQAFRIARTEATAAANYAAWISGKQSGYVMEKVWISSQDERTRVIPEDHFDHLHMNNKRELLDVPFKVKVLHGGTDELMYPGDPQGEAGNVINCRCALAVIPKRDRNGNLIRTPKINN